jgi:serine/threonine protein phosphatase PrpC
VNTASGAPALRWGSATDVGRVRRVNEDGVLTRSPLFAVADGMGGHAAGEVASSVALTTLAAHLEAHLDTAPTLDADTVVAAVRAANAAVFDRAAERPDLRGMGTTLCAVVLTGAADRLVIVNVGDSRVYVVQDGALTQITRDHSYVEELVAAGALTREEARTHPHRNIVTRALGIEPSVQVDAWEVALTPGDRYLLCSDGLFGEVDDHVIAQVLAGVADPQEAAERLVRMANEHGGRDNITAAVVDVLVPGPALPVAATVNDIADTAAPLPDRAGPAAPAPTGPGRRRPRLRVSSVLFVLAVLAVLGIAVGAVQHQGRQGYFVTFGDTGRIEVFKGRPGGLLWVEPTPAGAFVLTRAELTPAWQARIAAGITFTGRNAVDEWYEALSRNPDVLATPPTTTAATTTTTTTTPATTASTTTTTIGP